MDGISNNFYSGINVDTNTDIGGNKQIQISYALRPIISGCDTVKHQQNMVNHWDT